MRSRVWSTVKWLQPAVDECSYLQFHSIYESKTMHYPSPFNPSIFMMLLPYFGTGILPVPILNGNRGAGTTTDRWQEATGNLHISHWVEVKSRRAFSALSIVDAIVRDSETGKPPLSAISFSSSISSMNSTVSTKGYFHIPGTDIDLYTDEAWFPKIQRWQFIDLLRDTRAEMKGRGASAPEESIPKDWFQFERPGKRREIRM